MAVGDCERAFEQAARRDGIDLVRARFPWLNQRGHLGLADDLVELQANMSRIFVALGGIEAEQAAKRMTPLPGDFLHEQSGVLIEIDESQHFTTARLTTLELYPPDAPLGFSLDSYLDLCEQWRARSDKYRASKDARGFGQGGRVRQRAYHDALRDLAAPVMGHPPVVRVEAPDRDGEAAYSQVRDQLANLRNA